MDNNQLDHQKKYLHENVGQKSLKQAFIIQKG